MPDISMCQNMKCKKRLDCYRFWARPSPIQQWYAEFDENKTEECYWPIAKEKKDRRKKNGREHKVHKSVTGLGL